MPWNWFNSTISVHMVVFDKIYDLIPIKHEITHAQDLKTTCSLGQVDHTDEKTLQKSYKTKTYKNN